MKLALAVVVLAACGSKSKPNVTDCDAFGKKFAQLSEVKDPGRRTSVENDGRTACETKRFKPAQISCIFDASDYNGLQKCIMAAGVATPQGPPIKVRVADATSEKPLATGDIRDKWLSSLTRVVAIECQTVDVGPAGEFAVGVTYNDERVVEGVDASAAPSPIRACITKALQDQKPQFDLGMRGAAVKYKFVVDPAAP